MVNDKNTRESMYDEIVSMAQLAYDSGDKELAIILFTVAGSIQHGSVAMRELSSLCVSFADGMRRDVDVIKAAMDLFGADGYLDD